MSSNVLELSSTVVHHLAKEEPLISVTTLLPTLYSYKTRSFVRDIEEKIHCPHSHNGEDKSMIGFTETFELTKEYFTDID